MSCEPLTSVGYCGKVPSKGDFIQENLNVDFLKNWNDWLQAVIAVSKEQTEHDWLDYYLTSPIWHFSLSAGVCCDQAVVGTVIPSVDHVGRHYPFTLAGFHHQSAVRGWHKSEWINVFEQQILQVLEDEIDLDKWLKSILSESLSIRANKERLTEHESLDKNKKAWVIKGDDSLDVLLLLDQQYRKRFDSYSLWWTEGSDDVEPCLIVTEGLPQISQFISMLNGQWEARGWNIAELVKESTPCT
ncbi:type VI secretion system-associated protein TagF [Shewanella ulleungensis]|jgi:type VI secretion system protein ImpM|uniref:Type VI secretion-associated protein n=1 Tax=Shewanella ulleungensis TaxID=2282699 RepID=A0ABQ2QCA7_9GAMM|nr:type VI secretion system-associated protein TagF [Shewanella ulleungensis]MCL1149173.1 type VI secretion system-associated protein TagF [Shewanella ulleungensis]GGP73099.1 type VI secretion-associated protein [Shewanella ulleungensis]